MKPNDVTKSDHEYIWLEPAMHENDHETGRQWCQDDVWSRDCVGEECGGPTKYVRSDLVAEKDAEIARLTAATAGLLSWDATKDLQARCAELEALVREAMPLVQRSSPRGWWSSAERWTNRAESLLNKTGEQS